MKILAGDGAVSHLTRSYLKWLSREQSRYDRIWSAMNNLPVTPHDVERARMVVRDHTRHTPLLPCTELASRAGMPAYLKAESLQVTGSFKARGALNRLSALSDAERGRGVVAFSAGNHALAVAWAAKRLGIAATVVMPDTADPAKAAACGASGATVVQDADFVSIAMGLQEHHGLTLIHPFDDPLVMAGQGTLGAEILDDLPDIGTLVIGIGGGGLVAGCAVALRARRPGMRIVGVEPEGANTMARSMTSGQPERMTHVSTIADGLAPPFAGSLTFAIVRQLVDDVVVVPDAVILGGMRFLFDAAKLVAEPAGAAATGAILAGCVTGLREPLVSVVSGGNINVGRFCALLA
jgi:threonine dehydratase